MPYRTFSKQHTYSHADLINSKKIFHLNKNIQFYKSFSEREPSREPIHTIDNRGDYGCRDGCSDDYIDGCGELAENNQRSVFNSQDISSMCLNFNYIKNVSIPYSLYLNNIKSYIRLCEIKNVCDKSPINIIQGKTSYNCNTNIEDYTCKNPLKLYPHGLYACDNFNCTTCEEAVQILALAALKEDCECEVEGVRETILKGEGEGEVLKGEALREEVVIEEAVRGEVLKGESVREEVVIEEAVKGEVLKGESVREEVVIEQAVRGEVVSDVIKNKQLGKIKNNNKMDIEIENERDNEINYQNEDVKIIGYKIKRERETVREPELEIGHKIVKKVIVDIETGYKIERKSKKDNEIEFGYKIERK
jgi:hypothetical protein